MLPCTTALFSSGVPAARSLATNLGRSPLVLPNGSPGQPRSGPGRTWHGHTVSTVATVVRYGRRLRISDNAAPTLSQPGTLNCELTDGIDAIMATYTLCLYVPPIRCFFSSGLSCSFRFSPPDVD